MPSTDTLSIGPIRALFKKYRIGITADPFARNCELCEITNDLSPDTKAKFHKKADDFLHEIGHTDFVLFDPPYTIGQVKECYQSVGLEFMKYESTNSIRWTTERDIIAKNQKPGGIVMSCGYSTVCMGMSRGYEILEILIVAHGPAHSDTLVTVEKKFSDNMDLL